MLLPTTDLGGDARVERQLDGTEHRLLIVLQDQRQNLHHLAVAAGALEQMGLQAAEALGHIDERRPVAQGSGLALDHCQIVAPVVDRAARQVMGSLDDPGMLAQDLPLGGDDDPLRVYPQVDRAVGEGGRHAVAVALEVDEAGRRYALGMFDEAVERPQPGLRLREEGAASSEAAQVNTRRRPRYLLSGLTRCGICGGGYAVISTDLLGCSTARNKGACENRTNIRRDALEVRVLDALRHHLMEPDLFAEFCEEFTREMNRTRSASREAIDSAEAEVKKIDRDLGRIDI